MEYKDQFLGLHYFVTKIIRILRHPESSSHLNSGRFPRLSAFSINQIFWGSFHLKLSFWLLCNRKFHDVLGNYKSNLSSPSLRGLHQHNIANKEKIGFCLLTMTNATNISQSLKKKTFCRQQDEFLPLVSNPSDSPDPPCLLLGNLRPDGLPWLVY